MDYVTSVAALLAEIDTSVDTLKTQAELGQVSLNQFDSQWSGYRGVDLPITTETIYRTDGRLIKLFVDGTKVGWIEVRRHARRLTIRVYEFNELKSVLEYDPYEPDIDIKLLADIKRIFNELCLKLT